MCDIMAGMDEKDSQAVHPLYLALTCSVCVA